MSDDTTNLSQRMRDLHAAKTHDLPDNWLNLADEFDDASKGFFRDPQTVGVEQFLGCFARARKAWCAVTGEPLV